MPRKSTQIAVGGLSAALCVTLMLLSGLLPFSTYAMPTLAGVALIPAAVELGLKSGALAYAAVSLLSLIMVPDLETSLLFIVFFGYYPILRFRLERLRRPLRILLKLALFNAAVVLAYLLLIFLFNLRTLQGEFDSALWTAGLLFAGNLCFLIYDFAVRNVTLWYLCCLRNKLGR